MDSDDSPRFILAVRLMYSNVSDAESAVSTIERVTGGYIASEYEITEV